ncbi:manganese/iron transport system substrate-binding protein [Alkalispirochaeta americana]|uniref:Manganese/iron transport system substrate-binding protein n=1 Tax=Alkalispirochaeta americana TaxID=159291 RepID=A0A1N6QI51_9SPIO|nr:zinc ABC transporter substrate-binding protein [Alkalispirochaeta americana]SIQ16257.1 manganese/iron transport system substrate-binding protein [Alkalispirochaeta americana]
MIDREFRNLVCRDYCHRQSHRQSLKRSFLLAMGLAMIFAAGTVAAGGRSERTVPDRPLVVASFTVLEDLVRSVAGEDVQVKTIVPAGAELHEWELTPRNFADLEEAHLFLYNGYQIETWLPQAQRILPASVPRVAVAEETGVETIPVMLGDLAGDADPHLWMDPRIAVRYLEVIRDQLIALDGENASNYTARAAEAIQSMNDLYREISEKLAPIPPERRNLVSSEAAFLYFARAFSLDHDGIWGSNSEEEGTPQQLARIIDIIRRDEIGTVFYESTISDRYVRSVADETGAAVAGPLYVDSLGTGESGVTSYAAMMRANANLLLQELEK